LYIGYRHIVHNWRNLVCTVVIMNILEITEIIRSEREAERYVERICASDRIVACPKCGGKKLQTINDSNRNRCGTCRHTFSRLFGRWIDAVKISPRKWLWIVKLFELEMTSRRISEETGISYPTVLKAVNSIRHSILARTVHGREILFGRECAGNMPVFSCVESDWGRKIELVSRADIIRMHRLGHGYYLRIRSKLAGNCVLCGGVRHYAMEIPVSKGEGRIYLSYSKGEWSYIKEQLLKYHGIREEQLPVYLLVMEYRYENRKIMLFDQLLENLCSLMPKYEQYSARGNEAPLASTSA